MNRTTVTVVLSYLTKGSSLSPNEIGREAVNYLENYSHYLGRDYIDRDFRLESAHVLENAPNE